MCTEMIGACAALVGALIGAVVSLITSHYANKHSFKLAALEREEAHREERARREIETYEQLQEEANEFARLCFDECYQMHCQFLIGIERSDQMIDRETREGLKRRVLRLRVLESRALDEEVRDAVMMLREAEASMRHQPQKDDELRRAQENLDNAFSALQDVIGRRLRKLYSVADY